MNGGDDEYRNETAAGDDAACAGFAESRIDRSTQAG
jgi:hypothetical protein